MPGIAAKESELLGVLNFLPTVEDRLTHILELGQGAPDLISSGRHPENHIDACQSPLWVEVALRENRAYFALHSTSGMVRGLIWLHLCLWEGEEREAILDHQPRVLERCGLQGVVTMNRQAAVAAALDLVKSRLRKTAS